MSPLFLLLACSCGKNPEVGATADPALPPTPAQVNADPVADPDAPAIAPTDAGYAVYRALSVRDPAPTCDEVESLTETPVETLLEVIERAKQPPWVGMRAATCLIQGHGEQVQDTLSSWVVGEDTRGFAILVLDQLDALPEAIAVDLATQALSGPHADDASSRIAQSTRPALQALVQ